MVSLRSTTWARSARRAACSLALPAAAHLTLAGSFTGMLRLARGAWSAMIAHAHAGFPDEACGILGGTGHEATLFVPTANADASSRSFSIDGPEQLRAERILDAEGLTLLGVVHSHTHTDAYPSPTDVEKAGNPFLAGWRWVLVSLKHPEPVVRSYFVVDGRIEEEPIQLIS